ncbi:hypothetical protein BSKO_09730 [Bryopsis sp. KO-2023]|nr:hypothetical protein BSKO_09730 [Bryopsis sp. KO-2023]
MAYLASSDEEEYEIEGSPVPRWDREEQMFVCDEGGLTEKLEDIAWPRGLPWVHEQTLTSTEPSQVEDPNDDIERELAFHQMALESAKRAIKTFENQTIPWLRPTDYYAEMIKSDDHMAKVKEQLIFEEKKIREAEQRRKLRDGKKFQKQLQAAKAEEKQRMKNARLEVVKTVRKQRKDLGASQDFDMDYELEMEHTEKEIKKKTAGMNLSAALKSGKRQYKDAKFGKGGRKRSDKFNTSRSAGDMDSFKGGSYSEAPRPSKQKRLGKSRRAAAKKSR